MNTTHTHITSKLTVYAALGAAAVTAACGGSEENAPTAAVPKTAAISCSSLSSQFTHPNTVLTSVASVAAGTLKVSGIDAALPEHCVVKGKMNERTSAVDGKTYAIGFEMRLPTNWNGRFFYQANGGLDGIVSAAYGSILGGGPTTTGLHKGFAVISSDAGHTLDTSTSIGGGTFGIDPQARLDYGYNAVGQLTPMAKSLINTYYGKRPDKSYIVGTSNGGRHAMVAASRYTGEYDGFLAGSPGFNLPKAAVAQIWGAQQFATISQISATTNRPDLRTSFSLADTKAVANGILSKCDTLDGLADGIVSDLQACQSAFKISTDVPTCTGTPDGTCLTTPQKSVLATVMAGPRNSAGTALYTNLLWDPGISGNDWRVWKFDNSTGPRDPLALAFVFTSPPQSPTVLTGSGNTVIDYALNFSIETDAPKIFATSGVYTESAMSFMTPPNVTTLPKLIADKGRLLVVHGASDPVFSVNDTIKWYEDFRRNYGDGAAFFARLFIVPGMNHSRNGPATDQFDMVDALVNWVEQGIAPDVVIAKARGAGSAVVNTEIPSTWSATRTRPLCAYPKVARYNGSGSTEDASSFTCKE